MPRPLRAHQEEAVEAAVRALEPRPGRPAPANGLRATVVAACGTGKTLIGVHAARRMAAYGRVLVLVPTLELLAQTAREWRREGRQGAMYAVCSLDTHADLTAAGARTTNSAPQLALWVTKERRVTVYATYASLPVLREAHEGAYGLTAPAWDLVVVDEAHRTSGHLGKAWARIHDQAVIPAARRLYLTATPRIWEVRTPRRREVREGAREALPQEMAASMADERIYGPTVYELRMAEAIRRGLLARVQIAVLELPDPVLAGGRLRGAEGRSEEVRGARMAATQTAVLEAMAQHGLRTTITYHHRTVEAQAWAAGLPAVAARLHERAPERHPEPGRVWADWLSGEHEPEHRRAVLRDFAGGVAERAVVCNCKVLAEGVDVPAVDSIAIVDPKASVVEIVQAIGRAVRQRPGQDKLATVLVPVITEPDEGPDEMYAAAGWRPLVAVLAALRAHDEQLVEMLAVPQQQPLDGEAGDDNEDQDDEDSGAPLLLRIAGRRDPAEIRQWVRMQVINPERASWARGYAAAVRYARENGHLRVPVTWREPGTDAPLGGWISEQRRAYAAGRLDAPRVRMLGEIGMVWDEREVAWEEHLAVAREWYAEHGTLCAPQDAHLHGVAVGMWIASLRRPGALGADEERAAARAAQLAAIDPDWNPRQSGGWSPDWQRMYARTAMCVDGGADAAHLLPGVTVEGADVGRWLVRQVNAWGDLLPEQRRRLEALGVAAPEAPAPAPAKRRGGHAAVWARSLAAAQQYRDREGHLTVPRAHTETVTGDDGQEHEVRLGVWLANQRTRRASLTPERAAALDELGA
ncbi:Helicase associated domain protein [Streptomyces sp. NPDC049879]|uniref:DEAD/DEAH box helicase n=1 Tax=Streptomyces sp. NPDC049879 TaxID=3365598 RepID=UPI0037AB72F7